MCYITHRRANVSRMRLMVNGVKCCLQKRDPVSPSDTSNKTMLEGDDSFKTKESKQEASAQERTLHVAHVGHDYAHEAVLHNTSSILNFLVFGNNNTLASV